MATLKEIKTRMVSVKGIEQVTNAMKMVATVKLRHAQKSIIQARPYAHRLRDLLGNLIPRIDRSLNPLLDLRKPKQYCVVVVASDRGLCGAFNTHILNHAETIINGYGKDNTSVIAIGRKARDYFTKRGYKMLGTYVDFFNDLDFNHAIEITKTITTQYLSNDLDRVDIVYNDFKSAVKQDLITEQFLPMEPEDVEERKFGDMLFEPSQQEIVDVLVPKYLDVEMWRILLESNASEQGARMTAMENATEAAEELFDDLQLYYNKARQASITKELLDIVGGAEAIQS